MRKNGTVMKVTCSKKYEDNLKKTFKYVETTEVEKTIIINEKLVCDFNPDLYLEQRICRCMKKHNQTISQNDKINLMLSLNRKTKRFLIDCDQSLFEDFAFLSDVDQDMFFDLNSQLQEKSYQDTIFEATLMKHIEQVGTCALINVTQEFIDKNRKTQMDLVSIVKNYYHVNNVNYFVFNVTEIKFRTIIIYAPNINIVDLYFDFGENIFQSSDTLIQKVSSKIKINKILNYLKEYN